MSTINEKTYSDPSIISSAEACLPLITYNELEQATNYWNKENILGKGGFGVVFKGTWKNTLVAIKRLEAQVKTNIQYISQRNIKIYIYVFHLFRKEK